MTRRHFLKSLRSAFRTPGARDRRPACPRLESLEDRRTPSLSPVVGPVAGPPGGHPADYDDTRILVRFRPEAAPGSDWHAPDGTTVGRELPLVSGLREVHLAPGVDVEKALAIYRSNPLVAYAQPNYRVHAQQTPNDPGFGNLWGLHNTGQTGGAPDADIDAAEAWDHWTGNGSTIVAVIDTGVDYNHPDLAGNMWTNPLDTPDGQDNDGNGIIDDYHGANFIYRDGSGNPTGDPFDDHYHGTHVAGTIGAVGNNGDGVAGVSWNVQIMAIKFLDAGGSGFSSDAIDGLGYAVGMGAMISNNSWGGGPYDQGLYDAIASAGLQGHVFVAAAGNSGVDADFDPMFPAAYDLENIVSVAALDHTDQLAGFSNYGAGSVDLGAPGVGVYSTMPGNAFGYLDGTSMAAPHVSGVVALIRDLHPTWTAQQVKDQLLTTVDPLPGLDGLTVSGGRLNAAAAVTGTPPPDTTGPRVSAHTPADSITAVSTVRVTFSEAINLGTFGLADIGSFTGPGGASIEVTAVTPVPDSGGRRFDISFAEQAGEGVYTMVIGPEVEDMAPTPNLMDQDRNGTGGEVPADRYTATFTIDYFPGPDGFGYEAHPIDLEVIDLVAGDPGVFGILDGVDDDYAAVDLGGNTFTFYGADYTGANGPFVSSNGLITFGAGAADYVNTDLTSWPDAPAIAPLWDDWVSYVDTFDEVLGKFEDADGNGTADRLIIEWTAYHYGGSASAVTFQAILELNGGGLADAMVFNYPNLDTADGNAEGNSATIGIKDGGAQGPNRLLVSADNTSPFVGTGKALRLAVDPLGPVLRIADAGRIIEGHGGSLDAVFEVTLVNPPTDTAVTVNFATADGTGTAGSDYQATSGTLRIPAGQTTGTIRVPLIGDRVGEADETFVVNLSGATNATIADRQGVATIVNDDPFLRIDNLTQNEGTGGTTAFSFTVTLSAASEVPVTVRVNTANGTAVAGSDYQAIVDGLLTFNPGETSKQVVVQVTGDTRDEANEETFFVNLSGAVNAGIADGQAVGTIVDDDLVEITIGDVRQDELRSGWSDFVFTVRLSAPSSQAITVNFATGDGTAKTANSDYQARTGSVTFAPGEIVKTIAVRVKGDRVREPDETFFVNLTGGSGATLTDAQGLGVIVNDD